MFTARAGGRMRGALGVYRRLLLPSGQHDLLHLIIEMNIHESHYIAKLPP